MISEPKSFADWMEFITNADYEWWEKNIHPFVKRTKKDTDASYFRKAALFAMVSDLNTESFL